MGDRGNGGDRENGGGDRDIGDRDNGGVDRDNGGGDRDIGDRDNGGGGRTAVATMAITAAAGDRSEAVPQIHISNVIFLADPLHHPVDRHPLRISVSIYPVTKHW